MNPVRRRFAGVLVLGLVACVALAFASSGLSESQPYKMRVTEMHGKDAHAESDGGIVRVTIYGDEGGAELKQGDTVERYCRNLRGEWRCTRDSFGTRMAKIGGAFLGILILLGIVLSPEIRARSWD